MTSKPHEETAQDYLGRHTALSLLQQKPSFWRRIPYLRENNGRAPPIVLAVGDRRRVYYIANQLQNSVLLPEAAANIANPQRHSKYIPASVFGRTAMAIGTFSSIPVFIVETQMGSSATQIVLNEILSDQLTSNEYRIGHRRFSLDHKIVMRIGTAGGINCGHTPRIRVGDVVNATHTVGGTGAIMQTLSGLDFWRPEVFRKFKHEWRNLGPDFTITRSGHPRVECSRDVVQAIDGAGTRLIKNDYRKGGNITKDSLYAEVSDAVFLELCRTENCRTTEMELSQVAVAAHEHNSAFGMISAIVGILPGSSFAGGQKARAVAEERAVRIALNALTYLI